MIVLSVTYAFMRPVLETSSITSIDIKSCATITLEDNGESINLNNTHPMSKNRALQTTPYTFTVSSTCESYVGFNLYLATLNTNTLDAANIHYIITNNGSKEILSEGILSDATNALSDFNSDEQEQLNNGINGTFSNVYKIYVGNIPYQGEASYDLYLYVDGEITDAATMGKTFTGGVAVKAIDREKTFAEYIIEDVYTEDGANDLYYHDGVGTYTNADQEAGDNSYRYSGANPNNYVCFGSDAATCPNDNLYRIIGVFESQIKLIKYDYATDSLLGIDGAYSGSSSASDYTSYKGSQSALYWYYWDNISNSNIWNNSSLNTINLNTNFLENVGSRWSNLIAEHIWQVGGLTNTNGYNSNAQTAFNYEVGLNTANVTYIAKIGLMYVSDYYYSASSIYWNYAGFNSSSATSDYRAAINNNWLYMGGFDWTLSCILDTTDSIFFISRPGATSYRNANGLSGVRPAFYLSSEVILVGGSGTISDPYRIS